jgi:hypothetical protein
MKKITMWQPHVCGCVILYSWDTEVPQDERTHTVVGEHTGPDGTVFRTSHCGGDHPEAVPGEQLEGSAFHEDFKAREAARQAKL